MRCLHCGKWNKPFEVQFEGSQARKVIVTVFALDPESAEEKAKKKFAAFGEETWDLVLLQIREMPEITEE